MSAPVDYLVVGHVSHDVQADGSHVIGGTVSYAALTAAALRNSVGMVTSAGEGFDFSVFEDVATVISRRSSETTTFRNEYVNGYRRQTVYGSAEPLTPSLVPKAWIRSRVVHIGPIIQECSPGLVDFFAGHSFLGLTPQGWMRSRNTAGLVHRHPWHDGPRYASKASAVVFSLDDVQGDRKRAEALARKTRLLVLTLGAEGGVLFVEGRPMPFSALEVEEVDPTGAGDIFATTFFTSAAEGVRPKEAARFAACLASRSVTRVGLAGVPDFSDIAFCRSLVAGPSMG
ncbi:MAG: PfkB family carbohydrate kinase [Anaerolineae bacterium]